jgi:assimilatory nitrate reductase catalytic subunit
VSAAVRTTCPYCGVGCGVLARARGGKIEISGDSLHPANAGRLCSKGSALGETLGHEGRLLYPMLSNRRVAWDEALDAVAAGFGRIVREHGPDSVAFYVSGQLLTEDYYVANKLMKGFIGSANIDTNSRLCMSSAVAGHRRAFGEDLVPGCYEDFELADLVVLVGSNGAWCHPILHQRILRAKERRPQMRVVVLDPRRTPTCEGADLHLPLRAGSDVWLFNGLLAYLHGRGCTDEQFVSASTEGLDAALAVALQTASDIDVVAKRCGVSPAGLTEFYELFARTPRTVTAFSQGVNQSSSGTDKVSSIINCHLLTGRIGKPGAGPFSITGQPNAMGGREAGGLANMLAAHMELANPDHRRLVQTFWGSPHIASRPGLKAVDLFEAIHAGRVKAVWIMATNPVVSLPDADRVREALRRCELVVVSDVVEKTDTTAFAHVLLPAAAWGEKDGTVTNSERCISRQRAFLPAPGEARPDWWIVTEVARRLGFANAFAFESAYQIFIEHAALSRAGNDGSRAFNISALAGLTSAQFEALEPVQWPVRAITPLAPATPCAEPANVAGTDVAPEPGGTQPGTARLFGNGRFFHADGRARFVATPPRAPAYATGEQFPLVLNTGRIRDQWHTMTRTGVSPRLAEHMPEPFADMHAQDALLLGVREGELVRVSTQWGSLVARLRLSGEIARGALFVPIHWSARNASDARVGAVVNPAVDPESGEPEFKHTPARVEPFRVDWYGFLMSRRPIATLDVTWWTEVRGNGFIRYELAGRGARGDFASWARRLLGVTESADFLDYEDTGTGAYRAALLAEESLQACLFTSPRPELPERAWLGSLFARRRLEARDRLSLLAGQPAAPTTDTGPIVCSCHAVRRDALLAAIKTQALTTIEDVGARTKAGTNCGSCVAEIGALLTSRTGESCSAPSGSPSAAGSIR